MSLALSARRICSSIVPSVTISISVRNVRSSLDVKAALDFRPVHVAFYFDQSSYAIEFGPNSHNLYINPLVITYAFNNTKEDIVVSSVNEVFSTQEDKLYPEYLCMFFNRTEFDRYARFHSWGSARETFTWNDLIEVKIPIPDIAIQKSIAEMYTVYNKRKKINEQLKAQIKNICPILIRGSLEDGGEPNGEPA